MRHGLRRVASWRAHPSFLIENDNLKWNRVSGHLPLSRCVSLRVAKFAHGSNSLSNSSRYVHLRSSLCYIEKCTDAQENEERPLVLHTLPTVAKTKSKENEGMEVDTGDGGEPQDAPKPRQEADVVDQQKKGLSVSTTTIPRLISVVEIIKREYLVAMNAKRSLDLVGLYQYNEMGSLEDQAENERKEGEESAEGRAKMITEALGGTKR